jgi:hypothetical protein
MLDTKPMWKYLSDATNINRKWGEEVRTEEPIGVKRKRRKIQVLHTKGRKN